MEIERKWMVQDWPKNLKQLYVEEQNQGYLHADAPIVRIRQETRNGHTKNVLCIKSAGRLARHEVETEITPEQFEELKEVIGRPLIRKTRIAYRLEKDLVLEVNLVDDGLPTRFMYAEVEFPDQKTAEQWVPAGTLSDYLKDEVTYRPGQSMAAFWLATRR